MLNTGADINLRTFVTLMHEERIYRETIRAAELHGRHFKAKVRYDVEERTRRNERERENANRESLCDLHFCKCRETVFLLRVLPMQLYVRLLFGTHMIHMNTYIHMSVFVDRYIQQLC